MTDQLIVRTTLLQQPLPRDAVVAHVEVRRITIAPSAALGAHVHNGAVFGSIEMGSAVFQIGDREATILRVGDVFYEPADEVITRFDATDEGVTFLGYFLQQEGESPAIEFVNSPIEATQHSRDSENDDLDDEEYKRHGPDDDGRE